MPQTVLRRAACVPRRLLFISLHQAGNYPLGSGAMSETGAGRGAGYTINLPLPPGAWCLRSPGGRCAAGNCAPLRLAAEAVPVQQTHPTPRTAGSGSGAYRAAFDRVVVPALDAYRPQLILVSSGYDAAYMDPLSQMMLCSDDYRCVCCVCVWCVCVCVCVCACVTATQVRRRCGA